MKLQFNKQTDPERKNHVTFNVAERFQSSKGNKSSE
jgi:hypothetical protein